jgi:hypothetical protein
MFATYPYWDVSYLVAVIFTWGSVVWCINAFFVWLPLQDPSTEFPGEIANAGGITAFIGATIFEFGSVLLMIEAVNESRADCFGWAVEEVLEEQGVLRLKPGGCTHHHHNRKNLVGKGKSNGKSPNGTFWRKSNPVLQMTSPLMMGLWIQKTNPRLRLLGLGLGGLHGMS